MFLKGSLNGWRFYLIKKKKVSYLDYLFLCHRILCSFRVLVLKKNHSK